VPSQQQVVYVDGEFRNPGPYDWTNGMTLQDAITAAGGLTDFAHLRLRIRHADGSMQIYKMKSGYHLTNNPPIQAGDSIMSPRYYF